MPNISLRIISIIFWPYHNSGLFFISKIKADYINYRNKPNAIKRIMARNALENIWEEKTYLYILDLFLESDYIIAGLIIGRHLEHFVKKLCKRNDIPLVERDINRNEKKVSINKLANELEDGRYIIKEQKYNPILGNVW